MRGEKRILEVGVQAMIRAVDNSGETRWTTMLGEKHSGVLRASYSVGFSIIEVNLENN